MLRAAYISPEAGNQRQCCAQCLSDVTCGSISKVCPVGTTILCSKGAYLKACLMSGSTTVRHFSGVNLCTSGVVILGCGVPSCAQQTHLGYAAQGWVTAQNLKCFRVVMSELGYWFACDRAGLSLLDSLVSVLYSANGRLCSLSYPRKTSKRPRDTWSKLSQTGLAF